MDGNESQSSSKGNGIFNTEAEHLEKYVVPGAVAVGFLFILPRYLLIGRGFSGVDLGAAIIAVLVIGHVIESLKVYQWGSKVRVNFKTFNTKVGGFLSAYRIEQQNAIDKARALLFAKLNPSEMSGFTWNLVRWQKMTVCAVLLWLSAIEWFLFAALAILEWKKLNPFDATFKISVLKDGVSVWWSVVIEIILAFVIILAGRYIYEYGCDRQERNNNILFELYQKYRKDIIAQLKVSATYKEGGA
jgi:hypothetical protein